MNDFFIQATFLSSFFNTMNNPIFYTIEAYKSQFNKDLSISGKIIHGEKIGRKIDFPTANIYIENVNILPVTGVYAVTVYVKNKQYYGMMNVGHKPTFKSLNISFEVHILNFNQDIYDETIEVRFLKLLRNQIKFNSIDDLQKQLEQDKKETEIFFNIA